MMKYRVTNFGNQYYFKNKFSKYKLSKNDRALNRFLKLKFNVCKKFHIQKLVEKTSWFRTMGYQWNKPHEDLDDFRKKIIDESISLTSNDLKLKEIYVYDLLPREYLDEFKIKYLKFRNIFMKKKFYNRQSKDIIESFDKMKISRSIGCWFNVDNFTVKENSSLSKFFTYFSIEVIGLSESFYIIKYGLGINEEANNQLEQILSSTIYKDAVCISCGKWWRKKSFAGCYPYDLPNEAKIATLEDFLLELKSAFFKEVKSKLFSKFFSWDNIPPTLEIYVSQSLPSKEKDIFRILSSYGFGDTEYSEKYKAYFIPTISNSNIKELHNSRIIADEKMFKISDSGFYEFKHIEELIGKHFAEYFVLECLESTVTNLIYKTQLKLNKSIYSRAKLNKLINLKLSTEKNLYFYKRLYNEIAKLQDNKGSIKYIDEYKRDFKNLTEIKNPGFKSLDFEYQNSAMHYNIKEKKELIDSIYYHFDQNTKMIEDKFTSNVIKWTLVVGILTLLMTVFCAQDFYLIKEFIKIFTKQ